MRTYCFFDNDWRMWLSMSYLKQDGFFARIGPIYTQTCDVSDQPIKEHSHVDLADLPIQSCNLVTPMWRADRVLLVKLQSNATD